MKWNKIFKLTIFLLYLKGKFKRTFGNKLIRMNSNKGACLIKFYRNPSFTNWICKQVNVGIYSIFDISL